MSIIPCQIYLHQLRSSNCVLAKMLKFLFISFNFCLVIQIGQCGSNDPKLTYAENPMGTYQLFILEDQLVKEIEPLTSNLICTNTVSHYLKKYHAANLAIKHLPLEERATRVIENALAYYKFLSRLVAFLKGIQTEPKCQGVRDIVEKIFTASSVEPPSHVDLRQAILGILRIHYVYGFNATSELRLGIFGDINTGVTLDFEECLEIAQRAIFVGLNVIAYQWLVATELQVKEESNQRIDLDRAWNTLLYQVGLNCTDLLHPLAAGSYQAKYYGVYWDFKYYATCRGQAGQTSYPLEHDLRCYYKRTGNWYLALNPAKVEEMSRDPQLLLFHEFVDNKTADFLKTTGDVAWDWDVYKSRNNNLTEEEEESVAEYGQFLNSVPYYMDEEYYGKPYHPIIKRLDYKMDMVTEVDVDVGETGMLLYSSLGSHYDIHHDTFKKSHMILQGIGDRLANFLVFLSDTELGGHLGFPMVGVYTKPKKGNAVFWLNSHRDGEIDLRTFHVGCPIILGSKHIIRSCVYEYDNVFKYKCGLEPPKYTYTREIKESVWQLNTF